MLFADSGELHRQQKAAVRQRQKQEDHEMLGELFGQKIRRQESTMLDMEKAGKCIKNARMAKNMTQQDLAKAMSVSYQAVSSWELGKTMPDITKVGELCDILEISVDELLGRTGKTAAGTEAFSGTERTESAEKFSEREKDFSESEDEEDVEEEEDMDNEDNYKTSGEGPDWDRIIGLAPFLSEDTLNAIVKKALQGENADWDRIIGLAPFLNEDTLNAMVEKALQGENADWDRIIGLAPFLSENTLNAIVEKALQGENADWGKVESLAPFLSSDTLGKLISRLI